MQLRVIDTTDVQEIVNIQEVNGALLVSSRNIANNFEKRHNDVVKAIENLTTENFVVKEMFIESRFNHKGNSYKEYLMNRDGFSLLVMGFNGPRALTWKLKYIEAFNRMEEELRDNIKYEYENLSTEMKALLMHDKKIQAMQKEVLEVKDNLTEFKEDIPLFTVECEEVSRTVKRVGTKVLGGKGSKAYNDKSLRAKVYSDIHRQLKREFDVNSYKAIKRRYLSNAIDIVENYNLTIALNEQINMLNNQVAWA